MNKKIYITALHMQHGGVEMAISLLSNALVKRGYDVTILSVYDLGVPIYELSPKVKIKYLTDVRPNKKEFLDALRKKNIFGIIREGLYALKVLRLKKKVIVKSIKEIKDGIIISTRNEHSVLLSKYGNKNVLKIAQLHHDHDFDKRLLNDIEKHYTNIDHFTLLTESLTQEVKEMLKGKNNHTNCLTMENFLGDTKFEVDIESKEKILIAVGRLHQVKGFDRLLTIWSNIVKRHPDWKLYIVGDGEQKLPLFELANKLKIEDSVVFTGALSHREVIETMKKASIYAMTSYSEGFGFVIIEAMACALPAVAFDVRVGPRAIIDNGKNGMLVKDNDNNAFEKAVCNLIENEELRKSFSKNAIERACDFTEEEIMKKWITILESANN